MGNKSTCQMFDKISSDYDRTQELKAFEDTKAGVRGLVEAGVTKVPRIFFNPPDDGGMISDKKEYRIPVIDLEGINMKKNATRRNEMINHVEHAAETWGFFQVVNHGIPPEILDEMLKQVRMFNELPKEQRSKFYTMDGTQKVQYNSNFDLYRTKAAYWRDTICFKAAPDFPNLTELPIQFRDILPQYSKHVMNLGKALLELLSKALGLEKEHLNNMGCLNVVYIACHYYPPCPQPELTIGTPKHSDKDFLTVLQQDQIGGLQVLHQGQWIDVPPVDGGLIINIGDLLQVISNDRFKSSEHRVLANRVGPRISIGSFFTR